MKGRLPWQRSPIQLHRWKCPLERKGGGSLTSRAPGEWHSLHPRPLEADPDLLFAAHTSPCALSQTDELTSSTTDFLRISPTHGLNSSKPCQRPRNKIQEKEHFF